MEFFKDFSKIKVLIVGDVMIDRYWWGAVERISPEAPVPVVRLKDTSLAAGGAANVAANVAGLGAEPFLIGIIGNDAEAGLFSALLEKANMNSEFLIKSNNRPTTVKTRIIAHSQQVARIDQESNANLTGAEDKKLWLVINKLIEKIDIVVLSDYAKGVLSEEILSRLITKAKAKGKPVLVDPKGKNFLKYQGASILTPNQREAAEAAGLEIVDIQSLEKAGKKLIEALDLENLLVTRGEKGMTLFGNGKKTLYLKAAARKVYDVTGAGDTVIATLSVALGSGMDVETASRLANTAAGTVVEQVGTTAIRLVDLKKTVISLESND